MNALRLVHDTLVGRGRHDKVRVGCAGNLITAFDIPRRFAIGCIQSNSCHTGTYPTGVTTQDEQRARPGGADQGGSGLLLSPQHADRAEGAGAGRWPG